MLRNFSLSKIQYKDGWILENKLDIVIRAENKAFENLFLAQ